MVVVVVEVVEEEEEEDDNKRGCRECGDRRTPLRAVGASGAQSLAALCGWLLVVAEGSRGRTLLTGEPEVWGRRKYKVTHLRTSPVTKATVEIEGPGQ